MKKTLFIAVLLASFSFASAQKNLATVTKKMEGCWQLTKATDLSGKLIDAGLIALKMFSADQTFTNYAMRDNKLFTTANGKFRFTSDSTYEEQLEKSIFVRQKEPVLIFFKFIDTNQFHAKFHVNNVDVEEIWRRVQYPF